MKLKLMSKDEDVEKREKDTTFATKGFIFEFAFELIMKKLENLLRIKAIRVNIKMATTSLYKCSNKHSFTSDGLLR